MVTKDQLLALHYGAELHYTGQHDCTRTVGPRGGVTERITRVRQSGRVKTLKRDAERFEMPVKYGLYESATVDNRNAGNSHLPCDCPLNEE